MYLHECTCMNYSAVSDTQTMTCVIPFKLSQLSPVRTDFLKCNLGHSDALLWNSLPESIRAIRSIGKFKKEINPVHSKHSIPTRQSCKPVFIVILVFTNDCN